MHGKERELMEEIMFHAVLWNAALLQLVCVTLVVMWGQGTEATASPQPLKDATFKTLPVSDVMFREDVLWEKPARSRMECSVMCRGDAQCLMFTFRPATDGPAGSCRSHRKQHTAPGKNQSAPGARSFRLVKEAWIQKPCSNSSDCREPLAACFSGQCLCDGGLFYDHTDNACVKACTRGFAGTYLEYTGWDLLSLNKFGINSEDVTVCETTCTDDPSCVSFVRKAAVCYFKGVTAQDLPANWTRRPDCTFYQKTCV